MATATIAADREVDTTAVDGVREANLQVSAARGVGLLSVAAGAASLIAPRRAAALFGTELHPSVVGLIGARDVVIGLGLMKRSRRVGWLWARAISDIIDTALLATAPLPSNRAGRRQRKVAIIAVAGAAIVDTALAIHQTVRSKSGRSPVELAREQLVHFVSDMYSVEQQALAQLVTAPKIAGDKMLAEEFRKHYLETEEQAELVRSRLDALGGSASAVKNAIMKLGGKGFLLFAEMMPETPGRLVVHSYSYEAMEWAGYEMLIRFAARAGDTATVSIAAEIRDQERAMMQRLERGFDAAERVSHEGKSYEELDGHVRMHLAEVHAFESQNIRLLEKSESIAGDRLLAKMYARCETMVRKHAGRVEKRLAELDCSPSKLIDAALAAGGLNWGLFFQAQSDTPAKLAAFLYAVLHLQIGGYELLKRTAERRGDSESVRLCDELVAEKRSMSERLASSFDRAVDATLRALEDG